MNFIPTEWTIEGHPNIQIWKYLNGMWGASKNGDRLYKKIFYDTFHWRDPLEYNGNFEEAEFDSMEEVGKIAVKTY